MLDVHSLHRAPTAWKEFLLHIATISVGLLIAIGLEQAVELIHRHHELNRLRSDLRTEGLQNRDGITVAIEYLKRGMTWDLDASSVTRSEESHSASAETYPDRSVLVKARSTLTRFVTPSSAVWDVAKTNGTQVLLPRVEAAGYARLEHFHEQVLNAYWDYRRSGVELDSVEARFSSDPEARRPNLSSLGTGQLEELSAALMKDFAATRELVTDLQTFRSVNNAVLDGVFNEEGMARYVMSGRLSDAAAASGSLPAKP